MNIRCEINRRAMIRGSLAAGAASLLNHPGSILAKAAEPVCEVAPKLTPIKPRPERAVSLRQVSELLAAGKRARLPGLTRLDGYIIDKENRDVVIWGLAEHGQPELEVEDLVVALRSAHGRYLMRQDGIDYIARPLVSIDPDVGVFRQLRNINLQSPDGRRRHAELCKSPQTVRIEGIPRYSRAAKVLIDADYRMKMVTQGTVELPIRSPFPSSFAARVARWREEAASGEASHAFQTRYWFEPGRFSYQASEEADTVFVDLAQVVLHDEDQYLKGSSLVASGSVDEISRAFTCAWTDRMEDIYKAEPIWRDMHNIFRHFALARIIKDRDAFSQANFRADFLIDGYELPTVDMPAALPGLGRVEEYEQYKKTSKLHLAYQVCGGVSVAFQQPLEKNTDAGETRASGRSVLAARPGVTELAWSVTPGALKDIFRQPRSRPLSDPPKPKAPSLEDLFKS